MSFTAPQRERSGPLLPLAAMVDILFLLLIFFMTSSIYREQDYYVEVSPPATESGDPGGGEAPLVLTVDSNGEVFIGDNVFDLEDLKSHLEGIYAKLPEERVVIRGDAEATHGQIMRIKDIVFVIGFRNVSEAVQKQRP